MIAAFFVYMVPKARIELARALPTAPSTQRVYQFHHFGVLLILFTARFGIFNREGCRPFFRRDRFGSVGTTFCSTATGVTARITELLVEWAEW